MVDSLEKEDILSQKVINFMRDDENFITHPDKKKEQLRYRLDYLHVFHENFLMNIRQNAPTQIIVSW